MGRDIKKSSAWFWGLGTPEIGRSPIMREMTSEAMTVYANISFSVKNKLRTAGHEDVPWGYSDGPVLMRREDTARGLFTVIRLGLFEVADGGAFRDGRYRKSHYRVSFRWAKYDPDRPGRFILESPEVSANWKACFDADGRWKPGVNPKRAPSKSRAGGNFPVHRSDSETALSVHLSNSDDDPECPVGPPVGLTRGPPESTCRTL
ncbi:MAG: hypothetical protein IT350_05285 [Deltaproteobacteria bacterium]|nr:hypothetical protein [Deltaproteobacteria bacterium]